MSVAAGEGNRKTCVRAHPHKKSHRFLLMSQSYGMGRP
jgi:hypothetical protein